LDDVLVLLGKLADDAGRGDGIAGGAGQGSSAVQELIELGVAGLVGGEPGQGVLDNGVFYFGGTELVPQLGILGDGDTLVIHEDCGGSTAELLGQGIDGSL